MSDQFSRDKEYNRLRVQNFRKKRKNEELHNSGASESSVDRSPEDDVFYSKRVKTTNVNIVSAEVEETIDQNINQIEPMQVEASNEEDDDEGAYARLFSSDDESCDEDYVIDEDYATEDDSEGSNDSEIAVAIRKWARECTIAYSHVDALLKVLKPYHSELPLSSKTLMKVKSENVAQIQKFDPENPLDKSEYVYFGIAKSLQRTVNPDLHSSSVLELQFNMDGLPIHHSSSQEFWPILAMVVTDDDLYEPFPVAMYNGPGKPSSVELYLRQFVNELSEILQHGVEINGKHFSIKLKFICDTPARAFVKQIKGHTGFSACERCTVHGFRIGNRTVFPVNEGEPRTDSSFRNQEDKLHHVGKTPLIDVDPPIDLVKLFVLDFMHLGCLGITKKLLTEKWLKPCATKLSRENILRISVRMMNLSKQILEEFQRTTRSLGDVAKWKATEYRFFLLYCGIFVLKDILPEHLLKNFLLLSYAFRILSCPKLSQTHADHAQVYLERFILSSIEYYGEDCQTMNMHNLSHITEDVKNFRCAVSKMTSFPFENILAKFKRWIRSGNKPLAQVCRRLAEESIDKKTISKPLKFQVLKSKKMKDCTLIQRVKFNDCRLSIKAPNNVILSKNGDVLEISKMQCFQANNDLDNIHVTCKKINIIGSAFDYPDDSAELKIFEVQTTPSEITTDISLSDVDCKMVKLTIMELSTDEPKSYVLPLLHMG